MFSSLERSSNIASASVALFPRFSQNLMLFLCQINREIASGQMHDPQQKDVKISTFTQLSEILYTDWQDMLARLHVATTIAMQMAEPVPEIMDTPVHIIHCILRLIVDLSQIVLSVRRKRYNLLDCIDICFNSNTTWQF
jgi:hypothetical protein